MSFKNFCLQVLKPYSIQFCLIALSGIVGGICISFPPYFLKMIIDNLTTSHAIQQAYWPALGYVSLNIILAANFRFLDWIKYRNFPSIKKDIALAMFNYIKYHSHHFFQNHFAGSMSNKVNDMVVNLESSLNIADEFIVGISCFIIAIILMYVVHPIFALTLFFWCIIFFSCSLFFNKKIHKLSKQTSEAYSKYAGTLVDILSNISSVRLFSRFHYETDLLCQSIDSLVDKDRNLLKHMTKMRAFQDITFIGLIAVMIFLLLHLYAIQSVTLGDFALILTMTMSIFHMMWHLASRLLDLYKNLGKCFQAMSLLEVEHDISDKVLTKHLSVTQGKIEFKQVSFSYQNNSPIFIDKNMMIEPGSKVGLVGYSGSGKSTFINLILRLYDIEQGSILIDDQNIADVSQSSLRENISMIPQDISLFHRSLMDNIRYGNVHASDEEVMEASQLAHCHDFISELKEGYDTLVGERGIKLSGGQRQRIAIARAFLEDAPILILDEATSSLDSVTEKLIQESLHLAIQNRTTLIIAHRLSTLLEMDRILVFKEGQVIEDGSHDYLLSIKGHYAKMWAMQSNGFLPDYELTPTQ